MKKELCFLSVALCGAAAVFAAAPQPAGPLTEAEDKQWASFAHFGGAVATQVRVGNPLFTHVLFPTYVAALLWGGLMLRDARMRAFLPWRDRSES